MASENRLAAVLFSSVLLCLPALNAFLRGDLDAGAVGIRLAGAAGIAWGSITLVSGIVASYRSVPVPASHPVAVPVDASQRPRRRGEDQPVEPEPATAPGPDPDATFADLDSSLVNAASDG